MEHGDHGQRKSVPISLRHPNLKTLGMRIYRRHPRKAAADFERRAGIAPQQSLLIA
jgi:hypothetical protein